MTIVFWVIAGVLMGLVVLLLSRPLLRRRPVAADTSNQAALASIYREKLAELAHDKDGGALSESEYRSAHAELERRLIEDTRNDAAAQSTSGGGRRAVRTAVALLVAIPLVAISLYLLLGQPAALVADSGQPATGPEISPAELTQMTAKLAAKLEKNPDNPLGWVMLGRAYRALQRYDEAEQAYQRAGPAANADPALMLERVELAADRNKGHIEGTALNMLDEVLKKQPENLQAIFLAGYGAFNRQDYRAAIGYWERLQKQVPPDSGDARNLVAAIAEARTRMGAGAPGSTGTDISSTGAVAGNATIRGTLSLSPVLSGKVKPDDVVFIFARAPQGPPMPLAVIKTTVAELPLEFTLDDSKAMSPQAKLSLFKTVRVEARVAKSGDPLARPGDLAGRIESVKVGTSGLALTIDHVLP